MNNFPGIHILAVLFLLISSCGWREQPIVENVKSNEKENLVGVNRYLVEKDVELIESYLKRRKWEMKGTESGLYYWIYEEGKGQKAYRGDIISLKYDLSLLDGTHCYSGGINNPLVFRVGQGGVEAGLEEAVLLLRTGDKARLIIPPFLAHGLTGDGDKIPPRAIIIYELEVLSVKSQDIP